MTQKEIELSIISPVYQNEEIENFVQRMHAAVAVPFSKKYGPVEFIIGEDGSTDSTRNILKAIRSRYDLTLDLGQAGRGYIGAAKSMFARAKGNYIFFADSDLETDPKDFWKLWDRMQIRNLDIVVGFKVNRSPFYRVLVSKVNNVLLGLLFGVWLRDANCGFRIFKNEAAKAIIPKTGTLKTAYNAETFIHANRMHIRYQQVPVQHVFQPSVAFDGRKMPRTLTKAFMELLRMRLK